MTTTIGLIEVTDKTSRVAPTFSKLAISILVTSDKTVFSSSNKEVIQRQQKTRELCRYLNATA